jgi:23S rRNA (cytosine1962-C5)-methyltransferase
MEAHKETTIAALIDILGPSSILFRNDLDVRSLEGLDQYIETAYGESVDVTTIIENGHDFEVRIRTGQKTGWFFDQRQNRSLLPARFVSGRRVLDVYSYTGAWAIHAAKLGAAQVVCVESSAAAIECLTRNAEINGVAPRISIVAGDASDVLRDFRRGSERFDIVILDPPAFVKRRKDLATGLAAYKSLNRLALDLIRDNGLLVTSSCSAHVSSERFQATIRKAALQPRLRVSIIARGCQGFDHPIHPAIPETEYLKCLFLAIERPDSQGKFHSSAG